MFRWKYIFYASLVPVRVKLVNTLLLNLYYEKAYSNRSVISKLILNFMENVSSFRRRFSI